jgi:hypothetical protein
VYNHQPSSPLPDSSRGSDATIVAGRHLTWDLGYAASSRVTGCASGALRSRRVHGECEAGA